MRDFADIGVLQRPKGYYAYASQGLAPDGMHNIQCAFSHNLVDWRALPDRSSAAFVNPGASTLAADAAGQEWLISHATLRSDISHYDELRRSPEALWQLLCHTRRVMILDPIEYHDGWPAIPGGSPALSRERGPAYKARGAT